jgi:hypothetical protein
VSEPERCARILERYIVGDGGSSDSALSGLAVEVRTMASDRTSIEEWVKNHGQIGHIKRETLQAILQAIAQGTEPK